MCETRSQLAHGHEPLLARQENVHQMRLGHIGQQHHLASVTELAARQVHEPAGAQLRVLADGAAAHRRTPEHHREGLMNQGLPQQRNGRGVRFLDLAACIEHQHAARQPFDQRRQARREVLIARMRLAELAAQLRHLATQRFEGAGELFRNGTESAERCGEFAALEIDEVERIRCHAGEESNFCASAAFVPLINRLR
jgi:hypothetical protein